MTHTNASTWAERFEALLPHLGHAIRVVALWGPPGTGKSTFLARHAPERRHHRVSIDEYADPASLWGSWTLRARNGASETVWTPGPAQLAWQAGEPLVIDEWQRASGAMLSALLPILDSADSARWTLPTGETITPRQGFAAILTSNAPPDAAPEALRSRVECWLYALQPEPSAVNSLPLALQAHASMQISRCANEWAEAEAVDVDTGLRASIPWTFRRYAAIARLIDAGVALPDVATLLLGAREAREMMTAVKLGK